MRKTLASSLGLLFLGAVFYPALFATPVPQLPDAQPAAVGPKSDSKIVDLASDYIHPVRWQDSTVHSLVGNVTAFHNGVIITCDSAVRYSDRRIECFGNVLINKDSTYIYGERAEYNGDLNEARIYSELIKVRDGSATLYTHAFLFNTLHNVGVFGGGGVLTNAENLLESNRGYYYADLREVVAVDSVEMRNESYRLKGDSVVYNLTDDRADFFSDTNIWNSDGDYLNADRGYYLKADERYTLSRNGYILTPTDEMWSDTLDYFRLTGHVVLRHDIQIDNAEQKTLAFGDYGEYWREQENALLTRNPAVINYDPQQVDSLFMRSDTIWMLTVYPFRVPVDTVSVSAPEQAAPATLDSMPRDLSQRAARQNRRIGQDSTAQAPVPDSLAAGVDSVRLAVADSIPAADSVASTPTKAERKALQKRQRAEEKAQKEAARRERLKEIAQKRREKAVTTRLAREEKERQKTHKRNLKLLASERRRAAQAARKGKPYKPRIDTMTLLQDSIPTDSAAIAPPDSLGQRIGSPQADTLFSPEAADTTAFNPDSMYRMVKGYRNVKVYRQDFQVVSDSLVALTSDSTIRLYIRPIMWNESNQITSDQMIFYTARQQLTQGDFIGSPMMIAQLDTMYYNQVSGKEMTAFFRNNQIVRNDVNGNVQTIYYMQEANASPDELQMVTIDSGSATFYIDGQKVERITYRSQPTYKIFPLPLFPDRQERFLTNFQWRGELRPSRDSVFDRRIRASQRAEKEQLPQPMFPIRERIEEQKIRLTEAGRWSDRSEEVTPEVLEWVRSLDY